MPRRNAIHASGLGMGIGLALGGGFSRGFAHLGVLQILEQEQIPVSYIVGTSIGGLLGAAFADGISVSDLCDLGRNVHIRDFLRFQPSQPEGGTHNKDRIGQFVQDWFRADLLEELAIPTAIVATDLDTGAPYVFSRGPLDVAIRASCAFPGLVKPVEHEGRMLADGCIVTPVPTEIAARINGGCVLGVNVSHDSAISSDSENEMRVVAPAFRALNRSSLEPSWCKHADILLEPQVQHIDWHDFTRVDEAVSAGADAMRRALPFVRDLLARRSQLASAPDLRFRAQSGLSL